MSKGSIAIIGSGVSGLVAAKSLLEKGLKPVVFEKSNCIGGLWNYGKSGGSPLYSSLKTNVSKQMMAFSDYPFERDIADFPTHDQVIGYLKGYAQKFDLVQYIVFGAEVMQVEFTDTQFKLTIRRHTARKGDQLETAFYDKLVVATGRFDVPNIPPIPGLESFSGSVMHSKYYDTPDTYKGKSVLVVGAAASGTDIAAELHGVASSVSLSVRTAPWVIPKRIGGRPADHSLSWLKAHIPKKIREKGFRNILIKEYIKRGAPAKINDWPFQAPAVDLDRTRLVPNDAIIELLINQKVTIYPAVKSVESNRITFTSGDSILADAIILATGYQTVFPFFRAQDIRVTDNYIGLYQQIFHPHHPDLAFIGVANIVGAALPLMEIQSRYMSEVFAENVLLPSSRTILEKIASHKQLCEQKQIDPMRVQALSYLDEIAGIIGVSPKLLANTEILKELVMGPLSAFRYRLNGPGSNTKEARKHIKDTAILS